MARPKKEKTDTEMLLKAFADMNQAMGNRFDKRFDKVDNRLDNIEGSMRQMDERLRRIEERILSDHQQRIEALEKQITTR